MAKFKLLRGKHFSGGVAYRPGSVVESDKQLDRRFGRNKFQRLHPHELSEQLDIPEFDKLDDEDLAELAGGCGIRVGFNSNRETVIRRLTAYYGMAPVAAEDSEDGEDD